MGNTGQGSGNGGGGGTTRVPPQNTPAITNLANLQALAKKTGASADTQLAGEIQKAYTNATVDKNQIDTDTQRFWNATGLADKKPVIVKDEQALEVEKFSGDVYGQYFYHTDAPTGPTPDAKTYADQYMNGRQYLSNGIHGDGTYFSNHEGDSWRYGSYADKSYQIKGMLNSNAKVIKEDKLNTMISAFRRSHPTAYRTIERMNVNRAQSTKSVYAALFGYNVIQSKQMGHDYLTVLDRSATTIVKQGHHRSEHDGNTVWKYR